MQRIWSAGVAVLLGGGMTAILLQRSAEAAIRQEPQEKPTTCESLRAAKSKIYGFHPAQMSEADIETKGKELDKFWKAVQAGGQENVNCLKGMLTDEKADHNFQFDAASMLYQMDPSPDSLTLVRDSIVLADFQETDPASYLSLALALAQKGVDVQMLATRLLRYPNAVIHVPEYSLDLDSDTAALFLYGSMPADKSDKDLIKNLSAPEPAVRSSAAHLLGEQLDEESFRALSKWDELGEVDGDFRRNDLNTVMKYQAPNPADRANPKFTREQVLQTIAQLPHTRKEFDEVMAGKGADFDKQMKELKATQEQMDKAIAEGPPIYGIANHTTFMNSAVAMLKAEDFETLREARRKALLNVSDQSLDEYLAFTQVMIGLVNRLELYKEYRTH